ncbi:MAG TPA: glycosyltransferase [Syntrophomonadaceae bacterium]|nr:glycosyltransferase [Syntrophomonadaceae bacterium]
MNFVNVSTYYPRQCGLASFSQDLRDSLVKAGHKVWIAAISDKPYTYSAEVYCDIQQDAKEDYVAAARLINNSPHIQMVILQHEYGIFGGRDGEFVIDFVTHLEKPFLLVTHTVLPRPMPGQRVILQILARQAAAVISMSRRSAHLLEKVYGVPEEKIALIPHGVPAFERKDREALKMLYGYTGRQVITTFGLIGPSKGLEIGIEAVKRLVDKHPDVLYIIAGKTHPVLLEKEGESYREGLIEMCADMGLDKHVQFVNHFLEVEELGDYLYMTDVYLSPYPNRDQAVSGTLAYAVGCGRAIVSTPYEYALDVLKKQRMGLVAPEAAPGTLSKLMGKVLSKQSLKMSLEKKASSYGETIRWPGVAVRYADLAREVVKPPVATGIMKKKAIGGGLMATAKKEGSWG